MASHFGNHQFRKILGYMFCSNLTFFKLKRTNWVWTTQGTLIRGGFATSVEFYLLHVAKPHSGLGRLELFVRSMDIKSAKIYSFCFRLVLGILFASSNTICSL